MNDKLSERIRRVEEEAAEEQFTQTVDSHRREQRDRAMQLVGGFKAAAKIAQVIDTELMRGLERFQEERIYLDLGYSTMVEYLNSGDSPLSKPEYYERKALLAKEGDHLFDLYGSIGLSIRKRKLLGAGNVQREGDNVIIVGLDGDEVTIPVTETERILETLSALADANADKTKKLDKQKAEIDSAGNRITELYREVDRARAAAAAGIEQDPHSIAIVNLTFAYRAVMDTVGDMNEVEREQFAPRDFQLIADLMTELAAAYGRDDWTRIAPTGAKQVDGDDIDSVIANALDEDDNDVELTESL